MIAFLITKLVEYVKDTRIGYGDIKSSFEELLRKDNSVKIHDKYIASSCYRNIQSQKRIIISDNKPCL